MQKITIKVDGIKKRDKIIAQQERGGDRIPAWRSIQAAWNEPLHDSFVSDTVRQAQSRKWETRSSTTGVSPKKQAENAKLWR